MKNRLASFNDYEIYIIKRALIESSGEICFSEIYDEKDIEVFTRMLNEFTEEDGRRAAICGILKDE